jgi:Arc/MetJ-type ribon-helix-helix transcriptional regulator
MTVKTTLSFTDRHHGWIARQVEAGVYATQSAAVAAAVERMIEEEAEREAALAAMADEIRERMKTPLADYLNHDEVFARVYARLDAAAAKTGT